jgi:anti-sigma factor RsiW
MNAPDTSHEVYEQLAAGHALSALEPQDEQAFLSHLPGCAACEHALAEHTETLAHLAYDAAAQAPPASVLDGIRAGVAQSGRAGTFPEPAPAPVSLDAAPTRRRRDKTVRWTTAVVGVAAAVVMVAALVFVNHGLTSQQHQDQLAAAKLRTTVSSLLVPGARKIDLVGDNGGKGAVVVNGQTVSLVMAGVPVNDTTNSIYVLWEKSTFGAVRAVGTFDVGSKELSVINNLHLAQGSNTIKTFMVTREKGRTAPPMSTQPAVVAGDA